MKCLCGFPLDPGQTCGSCRVRRSPLARSILPPSKERERGIFLAADVEAVRGELALQLHYRDFLRSTSTHVRDVRGSGYISQIVDKEEMRRRLYDPMEIRLPRPPAPPRKGKAKVERPSLQLIIRGGISRASQLDEEIYRRGGGTPLNHLGREPRVNDTLDLFRDQSAAIERVTRRVKCHGFLTKVARERLTHLLEDMPRSRVLGRRLEAVEHKIFAVERKLQTRAAAPEIRALMCALLAAPPAPQPPKGTHGLRRNLNRLRRQRAALIAQIRALPEADPTVVRAA